MTDASANLAAVVLCPRRPMWGPRRPAGSLKGQPTAEPRPAAQHPSLSIKLASAVTGRAAGMPSRDLGCPRPHYKPRRGGGQARPRIHVHPARGPLHSRWRRASVPSTCIESEHADGPGRKRAAFALDDGPALLPQRHAIDANPVTTEPLDVKVLFFFYDKT